MDRDVNMATASLLQQARDECKEKMLADYKEKAMHRRLPKRSALQNIDESVVAASGMLKLL